MPQASAGHPRQGSEMCMSRGWLQCDGHRAQHSKSTSLVAQCFPSQSSLKSVGLKSLVRDQFPLCSMLLKVFTIQSNSLFGFSTNSFLRFFSNLSISSHECLALLISVLERKVYVKQFTEWHRSLQVDPDIPVAAEQVQRVIAEPVVVAA